MKFKDPWPFETIRPSSLAPPQAMELEQNGKNFATPRLGRNELEVKVVLRLELPEFSLEVISVLGTKTPEVSFK